MKTVRESFKVQSTGVQPTFHNVKEQVQKIVTESGVQSGICVVYSHHTTCCVITDESAFDMSMTGLETLQQDMVNVMEDMIPSYRTDGMYLHPGPKAVAFAAENDEDYYCVHNTDAHLRSSIIGRSETIVLIDGKLDLGSFGNIYFIDWDQRRARERTVMVQIIGE
ncbi:MAG: YjbQ family protein [Eubacterium sp.]|nr:YjbQ family protein [Eubacterium sp.]